MRKEKIINRAPLERIILEKGEKIKGYRPMYKDWNWKIMRADCPLKDHKYKTGETYHYVGEIELNMGRYNSIMCGFNSKIGGYDFCLNVIDCFVYCEPEDCIIVEVEAWGEVVRDTKMLRSEYITIGKEFKPKDIENLYKDANDNCGDRNSGNGNSGNGNNGDWNCGYWNNGDFNSGDYNSGNSNSGNSNSGNKNSGYLNSGDSNSGDCNSGEGNSGNKNSGDFNSGYGNTTNFSSGVFCTEPQKILIFDEQTELTLEEWYQHQAYSICEYAFKAGIDSLNEVSWEILRTIPNWDKDKFLACVRSNDLTP